MEKCVSTFGQIEKPISVCVNFASGSAKGIYAIQSGKPDNGSTFTTQKMKTTTLLNTNTKNPWIFLKALDTSKIFMTCMKATASS